MNKCLNCGSKITGFSFSKLCPIYRTSNGGNNIIQCKICELDNEFYFFIKTQQISFDNKTFLIYSKAQNFTHIRKLINGAFNDQSYKGFVSYLKYLKLNNFS